MDTRAQWTAFANGDLTARDTLLTENLNLVHHVARKLERKLSTDIDHDELVSAGTLGLISAMSAFDPDRGLAFSTFAVPRIRGAILDEFRRQDHVPRSVRRKTRDITSVRSALSAKLCRAPDGGEVAAALGVDMKTLWRWESDVESATHVSIDRPAVDRYQDRLPPLELLHTDPDDGADAQIGREQEIAMLRRAIMKLKEQERTVLALHYFEGLKLYQIAETLGLTESRVSQIRSKAVLRLREATIGMARAS